jgi:hypothetical protein
MATTSQSKTFHTLGILGIIFGIIMAVIALLTIVTEVGVDLGDNDLEKAAVLIKMTTMGVNGVLLVPLGVLAVRRMTKTCRSFSIVLMVVAGIGVAIAILAVLASMGNFSSVLTAVVDLVIPYLFFDQCNKVLAEKDE